MARDLLIVFGNDTNPGLVQTWAISNQGSQDVDPGDAAYFDITVGGVFFLFISLIILLLLLPPTLLLMAI